MADPDTEHTLRWLLPIFRRRREDGSFHYSDEKLRAFLPALLVSLGFDPDRAPPFLAAMVGELARAAGVESGDPRDVVASKLRAHLDAHPLDPELVFEVSRGMREELATYSPEELARDVAGALGLARPSLVPRDAPPPVGAVKAGPMARFALSDDPPAPKPRPKKRR